MSKALALIGGVVVCGLIFMAYIWFTVPDPRIPPPNNLPDEASVATTTK